MHAPTLDPDVIPLSDVSARGPLSAELLTLLASAPTGDDRLPVLARLVEQVVGASPDVIQDDDVQLALFLLYGLHYGTSDADAAWEWHPALLGCRVTIEEAVERTLRESVEVPELSDPSQGAVAAALFALTAPTGAPGVARFVARKATVEQAREFLVLRSIYTLREADPHSWAIPRLTGRAKAAFVEIQSDEYGASDPEHIHATIFAGALRGAGLDDGYGVYLEHVPAVTLAAMNVMSMFGLHRRLLGATVGHLCAFEMTSAIPNRFFAEGFRRLGYGHDVTWYFDEHVEADAVHEQIAARDLAGSLGEDHPELLPDIAFGAAVSLWLDDLVGAHILGAWESGRSALRMPLSAAA